MRRVRERARGPSARVGPRSAGGGDHGRGRNDTGRCGRTGPPKERALEVAGSSRVGCARRGGARLGVLRDHREREQLRQHGHDGVDPEPGGAARHLGGGGCAADDLRRVRPVDRVDPRLLRDGDHDPGQSGGRRRVRLVDLARDRRRVAAGPRHGRDQRAPGQRHEAAVVHRDARDPVHLPRSHDRDHAPAHEPDAARQSGRGSRVRPGPHAVRHQDLGLRRPVRRRALVVARPHRDRDLGAVADEAGELDLRHRAAPSTRPATWVYRCAG